MDENAGKTFLLVLRDDAKLCLIEWEGGSEPLNQIALSKHVFAAPIAPYSGLARVMTR